MLTIILDYLSEVLLSLQILCYLSKAKLLSLTSEQVLEQVAVFIKQAEASGHPSLANALKKARAKYLASRPVELLDQMVTGSAMVNYQ